MRTYLITYDIADPADRQRLASAIMALGEAWARPLETAWYVRSRERQGVIQNRIASEVGSEDGVVIQQVESEAVLLNTGLRWFKRRRQEMASEAMSILTGSTCPASEMRAA
jgi:hypothetical protein